MKTKIIFISTFLTLLISSCCYFYNETRSFNFIEIEFVDTSGIYKFSEEFLDDSLKITQNDTVISPYKNLSDSSIFVVINLNNLNEGNNSVNYFIRFGDKTDTLSLFYNLTKIKCKNNLFYCDDTVVVQYNSIKTTKKCETKTGITLKINK